VLAKPVSSADWRMNHLLFGDYYCPTSVGLVRDVEPLYLDDPAAVRRRDGRALRALFHALLLTGVSMTIVETSFPASGGEHLIGHSLDMMSALDGVPHDLHGRQVGVGTILTSALYQRVLAVESPDLHEPLAGVDRPFWGRLAGVVEGHYRRKVPRLHEARKLLAAGHTWDALRAELAAMARPPQVTRDCLKTAGAAYRAEDIGCDRLRLLAALLHAHEMRSRFTVLDAAYLLGILPGAAGEIVEQWA